MRLPGGLWRHPDFMKLWAAETISQLRLAVHGARAPARRDPRARCERVRRWRASAWSSSGAVHPVQPACGRLGGSAAAQADPRRLRSRPGGAAGVDPGRALARRADDLAALRRRLLGRRLHRLLRRRVPVVPPVARRARPAPGRQLEARDQPLGLTARRPRLAGRCISAFGAPVAVLLDAISFLVSALFLFAIRKPRRSREPRRAQAGPGMMADARKGSAFVLRNRYLRAISICTASSTSSASIGFSIFLVYAVRELELSPPCSGCLLRRKHRAAGRPRCTTNRISRPLRHRPDDPLGVAWSVSPHAAGSAAPKAIRSRSSIVSAAVGGFGRRSTTSRRSASARRSAPSGCRAG